MFRFCDFGICLPFLSMTFPQTKTIQVLLKLNKNLFFAEFRKSYGTSGKMLLQGLNVTISVLVSYQSPQEEAAKNWMMGVWDITV